MSDNQSSGPEISDLEINTYIRRLLTKKRIDSNKLSYRSQRGCVNVYGELAYVGLKKEADEMPHEIASLEDMIKQIKGVKRVTVEIEGFEKNNAGDWLIQKGGKIKTKDEQVREKIAAAKKKEAETKKATSNIMMNDSDDFSAAADAKSEVLKQIMAKISKITIKCPECKIEYKYCLTCGSKLKIEIDPKVDFYSDASSSQPKKSPAQAAPKRSIDDILAEGDLEDSTTYTSSSPEPEEKPKEEAPKKKSLAELARESLLASKESSIKKKGWKKQSPMDDMFTFDDI
jgi:hypothetical protein